MAYVPNQQTPENEQNIFARKDQTTPNPVPPQSGGSAGAGPAGGPGGGAPPGVGTSTQFGSNAAKLSDYLNANKEQVGQFGNQVAGTLTQNYNDTTNAINQGIGSFGEQVKGGYAAANPDLVNQAATNPTEFVKNPGNVKTFQSMFNDQYSGPQNFEGSGFYGDLNDRVNKSVENAGLTKTAAGLGTYLNNSMGAQDTTPGMRTLDTALLMGSPEARTAMAQAAAPFQNLNSYLSGQTQKADTGVANAKTDAAQIASGVQGKFTGPGGVIPEFKNRINTAVTDAKNTAQNQTAQKVSDVLSGNATPDELAAMGIAPGIYDLLQQDRSALKNDYGQNFNLDNYFTNTSPDVAFTPQSVATPNDYAEASALSQLTGQDLSSFLNPASANQAQTAPNLLSSFNLQGADADASKALKQQDQAYLQANPLPSFNTGDTALKQKQLALFQRNPSLAQNSSWAQWWSQNQPGAPVINAPGLPGGPDNPKFGIFPGEGSTGSAPATPTPTDTTMPGPSAPTAPIPVGTPANLTDYLNAPTPPPPTTPPVINAPGLPGGPDNPIYGFNSFVDPNTGRMVS